MRSIKPGRGPSLMGGVIAAFVALAGVGWMIAAFTMGAPWFFALFGIGFIIAAVCMALYHFRNAFGRHRFSIADVVEGGEEADPLNRRFGPSLFCRRCGVSLPGDANFCSTRGTKIDR